tara:strand:- start:249 stop:842 length:594 start_codon:yes stop_codon:yes gene_type:complete
MMPIDSLLKRINSSEDITYSLAEGNILKGKINDLSFTRSSGDLDLGNYEYTGIPQVNGMKFEFASDNELTKGIFKLNLFSGTYILQNFITKAPYTTNGLGVIEMKLVVDNMVYKDNECKSIQGQVFLSNNAFDESVNGNIRCLNNSTYEVDLYNSRDEEMGLLRYRPGFIDLEIETAILKADVSVFLGKRMGFTIPL